MADTEETGGFDLPKFIWGGNTGLSYGDLQHRRAIAQALASRKMGFPKNKGEGLTYLGESFNEGVQAMMLAREERARQAMLEKSAKDSTLPMSTTPAPTATAAPPVTTTTPPVTTTAPPPATATPPASTLGPYKTIPVKPQASAEPQGNPNATFVPPWTPPPAAENTASLDPNARFDPARFAGSSSAGSARAVPTESIAPQTVAAAQDTGPPATGSVAPPYTPGSQFADRDLISTTAFTPPTGTEPRVAMTSQEEPLVPETGGGGDAGGGGVPVDAFVGPRDDPRKQAWERGIASIESAGSRDPYNLQGVPTRGGQAQGKFQVMSGELPEKTQKYLGYRMTPAEFRASPNAQHAEFRQEFGDLVKKYGEEGAAKAWYAGERGMHNPNATDVHGRVTVSDYGRRFLAAMGQPAQPGTEGVAATSGGGGGGGSGSGTTVATGQQPGADYRDGISLALMEQNGGTPQQPQPEEQPQDTSSEAKLLELVGGGRKPGSPFRATASLGGRAGGPASDAPQPGLQPMGALGGLEASAAARRDAIAGGLAAQPAQLPVPAPPPAQEVPPPPPDPTQPGISPSPTISGPAPSASPVQLAQAGPLDASMFSPQPIGGGSQGIAKAPAPVAAPAPTAAPQTGGPPTDAAPWVQRSRPTPPAPPAEAKYDPQELAAIQRMRAAPNDPEVAAQQKPILDYFAARRAYENAREIERYKGQLQLYNTDMEKWQEGQVNEPKRRQDYRKEEQTIINQPPGGPPVTQQSVLGTPASPQRSGIPTVPPVPAGISPQKWAELQSPVIVKAQEAVDQATPQFQDMLKTIKQVREHPGKEWGTGPQGYFMRSIPGTDAFAFDLLMKQLGGKNFLAAYNTLKGGGQISNVEGDKAQEAQATINPGQSKEDLDKSLTNLENIVRRDMELAQRKVNQPVTAWRRGDDNFSYAPDRGQPVTFKKDGKTREYIGGDPAELSSYR